MTRRSLQTLLVDADDTLWENNVYFERAIERFMALLVPDGNGTGRRAARERLNQEERRVIVECGYGLASFRLAITRCFQAIAPERWNADAEAAIAGLEAGVASAPIEFMPGAAETMRYLAERHRLILMTKGDYAEQTGKVARSGLGPLFEQVCVVPEKDAEVYRRKRQELGAAPETCWMIGNSPRSDINPALAAGMNAVFIPHPWTWVLEHDEIAAAPERECLRLERIGELRDHF